MSSQTSSIVAIYPSGKRQTLAELTSGKIGDKCLQYSYWLIKNDAKLRNIERMYPGTKIELVPSDA